ncbi:protein lin-52 homolog isoform X3 [Pithys albifrons albifrons]|uniref:protein lin-52 homolog isoform X3 n=1 Tax=Pithys albifrons albifrons TaxID=3385563 RepID=UPI003A5CF0A6
MFSLRASFCKPYLSYNSSLYWNKDLVFNPITSSPPKWMAELENDDIDMLKELGSLTTANLMEKVRGLQNLAYQLGLDESREMTRGKFLNILEKPKK